MRFYSWVVPLMNTITFHRCLDPQTLHILCLQVNQKSLCFVKRLAQMHMKETHDLTSLASLDSTHIYLPSERHLYLKHQYLLKEKAIQIGFLTPNISNAFATAKDMVGQVYNGLFKYFCDNGWQKMKQKNIQGRWYYHVCKIEWMA